MKGLTIAMIVVLLVLVLGGIFFMNKRSNTNIIDDGQIPVGPNSSSAIVGAEVSLVDSSVDSISTSDLSDTALNDLG